jgi:tRNA/rRNA methyltransferase
MFAHVEEALTAIGFLKNGEDDYWMKSIRQFLGRIGLKSKEIKIIRGVCRQLLWRDSQCSPERAAVPTDNRTQLKKGTKT